MTEDFNLSEKMLYEKNFGYIYSKEDVKEFIKRLKEEIENPTYPYNDIFQLIDNLAGDDLK
jgi:hypothetical protein